MQRAHDVAKLHTDQPQIYTRHGFRTTPTYRFRSAAIPASGVQRRLLEPARDPAAATLLRRLLAERAPVSHRCASADDGWMVGIVAALSGRLDRALWWLPEHEAIVVVDDAGDEIVIVEVFAARLPSAEVVAGVLPDPTRCRFYAFSPDRLEPQAEPVTPPAEAGVFMVRGTWPLSPPCGLSPLWEH